MVLTLFIVLLNKKISGSNPGQTKVPFCVDFACSPHVCVKNINKCCTAQDHKAATGHDTHETMEQLTGTLKYRQADPL